MGQPSDLEVIRSVGHTAESINRSTLQGNCSVSHIGGRAVGERAIAGASILSCGESVVSVFVTQSFSCGVKGYFAVRLVSRDFFLRQQPSTRPTVERKHPLLSRAYPPVTLFYELGTR